MESNLNLYLLPESEYPMEEISLEDVKKAYIQEKTITGYVDSICKEKSELIVDLGCVKAHMPFEEASIYPNKYSKDPNRDLPVTIGVLLHSNIRVKVTSYEKDYITVSRKMNMKEASDILKSYNTVLCKVTSCRPHYLICDIGDGVTAFMHITEMSIKRLNNVSELFHVGDTFTAKIIEYNDEKGFSISYKSMFKEYDPNDYRSGDVIQGIIKSHVKDKISGYLVFITPQVYGILDTNQTMPVLVYGDKIEAVIKKADSRGPKLRFVKKV